MGAVISGKLSNPVGMSDEMSVNPPPIPYDGDYAIAPKAFTTQVIPTANRQPKEDLIIAEMPFSKTVKVSFDG